MWTSPGKQMANDKIQVAGLDKKTMLPLLPMASKASESLPTLLEAMSPAFNAMRKVPQNTPTGKGRSPASIARLNPVSPTGVEQSPASIAKLRFAATTPPTTAPKRNLKALVKDNSARPWTGDPATLKQADKEKQAFTKKPSEAERGMLKKKLFEVVDRDGDGYIHYSEFLELQRNLLICDGVDQRLVLEAFDAQHPEKEFRKWDADFSLGIDEFEWGQYMETIIGLVGKHTLNAILDNLIRKRSHKLKKQGSLSSLTVSERLLQKATNIPFLGKAHVEQADVLLQKGADPNVTDDNGENVLHHLAAKCEPAFMAKLMERGGNPGKNNNDFDCAVLVAARARCLEVLRVLMFPQSAHRYAHSKESEDALSSRLILNMHELHAGEIRELVQNGADINYRNVQGWIPLTSAVFWGNREAVELLIRLPVTNPRLKLKVDIPNLKGRTALHVAARSKDKVDLIPLLIGARADVNARDMEGWTPLHHAVWNRGSEAVRILHGCGANMTVRSHHGITPFMLASSPSGVAEPLSSDVLELLQPPNCVRFKEVILPILKNDSLLPYEKICALMDLPGVYGVFENLRLYDQVFRLNRGPNKVQLNKLWELIGKEMLTRLRSGEVDVEPVDSHCSETVKAQVRLETKLRQEKQEEFVRSWLLESAGPPASSEWSWDNREGYREEITECIRSEIQGLNAQCENMYEAFASDPNDPELLGIPQTEILHSQYLTQLGAHPILKWIDCADIMGAFDALCDVKTFGSTEDDNEALVRFMEMVSTDSDFMTGPAFWQNVYKLWLSNFASLARPSLHVQLRKFVEDFNSKNTEAGLEVSVSEFHTKTFQELKACEREFGKPGYQTHDERLVASKALDVISCCMVANSPAAVEYLIYAFRQCTFAENKFELVRIQNGFHKDAESCNGLREVTLNIIFKGGHCHSRASREGAPPMSIMLVGEVRIVIPQIDAARKGMKLLSEFLDGNFDPKL